MNQDIDKDSVALFKLLYKHSTSKVVSFDAAWLITTFSSWWEESKESCPLLLKYNHPSVVLLMNHILLNIGPILKNDGCIACFVQTESYKTWSKSGYPNCSNCDILLTHKEMVHQLFTSENDNIRIYDNDSVGKRQETQLQKQKLVQNSDDYAYAYDYEEYKLTPDGIVMWGSA